MSKKLKLLSLAMGAVSFWRMVVPLAAYAEDPKKTDENSVSQEMNEDFSVTGINSENVNQLNEDGYAPLHLQMQEDNLGAVEFLISKGADVSLKDKNGDTPLHTAAREDAIACLSCLISKGADVEAKNSQGETPLMLAAKEGNRSVFFALLGDWLKEKRANINAVDDDNNTILHCLAGSWMNQLNSLLQYICHCSEEDLCASLREMINRKNNAGETPLFNAVRSKNEEVAMLLIKNGAKPDDNNNKGQTPLMLAGEYGLKNLVKELVRLGANIQKIDNSGNTLLHFMAHDWDSSLNNVFNDPDNVKYTDRPFLQLREMINATNDKGKTPLFISAKNNQSELARLLIENGANVNCLSTVAIHTKDNMGYLSDFSPLHIAAAKNNFEVAKVLIENGAQVNFKNTRGGEMPLHIAAQNNSLEVADLLIKKGANVDYETSSGMPIHLAAETDSLEVVQLLLSVGVDPSVVSPYSGGLTPLHVAARNNSLKVAKLLIEKGASIEAEDYKGGTPLQAASGYNYIDVARLLIASGANVNHIMEGIGYTPLHSAAFRSDIELLNLLIDSGGIATINHLAEVNQNPLIIALISDRIDVMEFLISKGADVNQLDLNGYSLLHIAVKNNNVAAVELLIKSGANVNIKNSEGQTPLDLATDLQIRSLLEEAISK